MSAWPMRMASCSAVSPLMFVVVGPSHQKGYSHIVLAMYNVGLPYLSWHTHRPRLPAGP